MHTNCKQKLDEIGIRSKKDKEFFLDFVFGKDGLVECATPTDLSTRLESRKTSLDIYIVWRTGFGHDRRLYFQVLEIYEEEGKNDGTAHDSLSEKAGWDAINDHTGKPDRPYTNQSESLNNNLTRQKEAMSKAPKSKVPTKKLFF